MKISKLLKVLGLTTIVAISSQVMSIVQGNKVLAQNPPSLFFLEKFVGDGDISQCNGAAYGTIIAPINQWSQEVRIDTDRRAGGCLQSFAVLDPRNQASDLSIFVDFEPDGDAGQCGNSGFRPIPVIARTSDNFSDPYRIDTDNRAGGCLQTFYLFGRNDIVLDVRFTADGDPGQCGNTGTFTVTPTTPVTFRIDTDNRAGGCREAFRLRYNP